MDLYLAIWIMFILASLVVVVSATGFVCYLVSVLEAWQSGGESSSTPVGPDDRS